VPNGEARGVPVVDGSLEEGREGFEDGAEQEGRSPVRGGYTSRDTFSRIGVENTSG
jgi:hypothetical protein